MQVGRSFVATVLTLSQVTEDVNLSSGSKVSLMLEFSYRMFDGSIFTIKLDNELTVGVERDALKSLNGPGVKPLTLMGSTEAASTVESFAMIVTLEEPVSFTISGFLTMENSKKARPGETGNMQASLILTWFDCKTENGSKRSFPKIEVVAIVFRFRLSSVNSGANLTSITQPASRGKGTSKPKRIEESFPICVWPDSVALPPDKIAAVVALIVIVPFSAIPPDVWSTSWTV